MHVNILPQITKTVQENRRIGLGVMGWADLLLHMGIPYNPMKVKLAEKVMKFVQEQSWISSEQLAKEKRISKWKGYLQRFDQSLISILIKILHANPQCCNHHDCANGTISMAAECSSGIEPVFALLQQNVVDSAVRM